MLKLWASNKYKNLINKKCPYLDLCNRFQKRHWKLSSCLLIKSWENCIQNFLLVRYIMGYTVRNLFLIATHEQTNNMIFKGIYNDKPPQMNILNMVMIPIVMQFCACLPLKSLIPLKLECCRPPNAACHPTKCNVINVKLYPTFYCNSRIYSHNFFVIPIWHRVTKHWKQVIFWPSLGAKFRLHSQSKIATFSPIPCQEK